MPLSAVLVSEGNKRVSRDKNVKAARYRVNNGDQVLMLLIDSECP